MIKILNKIIFCILILLPQIGSSEQLYIEYSESMAKILNTDNEARDFISQMIGEQNIVLFAGDVQGKVSFSRDTSSNHNKFDSLLNCFSDDRLNDNCDANDLLERDSSYSNDFNFISESQAQTNILFTSHDKSKMLNLEDNIRKSIPYFYLLFLKTKNNNNLFYLSSSSIINPALLVGVQPFDRNIPSLFCNTICNKKNVNLLKCFQGKPPGFINKVKYLFPEKALSSHFIECPDNSSPPNPIIKNLDSMYFPYSEIRYYKKLARCIKEVTGNELNNYTSNVLGVKIRVVFTVYRTNPDLFQSVPKEVGDMMKSLANESEEQYLQPLEQMITMTIKNCQ